MSTTHRATERRSITKAARAYMLDALERGDKHSSIARTMNSRGFKPVRAAHFSETFVREFAIREGLHTPRPRGAVGAEVKARMVELYGRGTAVPGIAKTLDKERYASPGGRRWSPMTVRGVLAREGVLQLESETTEAARFDTFIRPQPNGCWLWTGLREPGGAGRFRCRTDGAVSAARFAYRRAHGRPLPAGAELRSICPQNERRCISPSHWAIAGTLEHFATLSVLDPETGCLMWAGAQKGDYGILRLGGRTRRAHRVAYELMTGEPLPPDVHLHHVCRHKACVNAAHLLATSATMHAKVARSEAGVMAALIDGSLMPELRALPADDIPAAAPMRIGSAPAPFMG